LLPGPTAWIVAALVPEVAPVPWTTIPLVEVPAKLSEPLMLKKPLG